MRKYIRGHFCYASDFHVVRLLQIDVRFSRSFAGIYQSVFLPRNTAIFTLGMDKIADGVMADGILTSAGKTKWHTSTINKILRNEKYMGDDLLQKTYITDFLTKKRIKNNGTVPQYYVEGDHEAIIPKELFMRCRQSLSAAGDGSVGDLIYLYKRDGHFAFASAYLSLPHQFGRSSFNVTVFRCSKSSIISIFSFSSFN